MTARRTLALSLMALSGCTESSTAPVDRCDLSPLPLRSGAAAPVVTEVTLEVQTSGIVLAATADDPQGTSDLLGVRQTAGIFPDMRCEGMPLLLGDDLAGSGLEETFGTVADAVAHRSLYTAISTAERWPVVVDFRDKSGNRTTGRVMARVIPR